LGAFEETRVGSEIIDDIGEGDVFHGVDGSGWGHIGDFEVTGGVSGDYNLD
jgi:hypothetical protein